MTTPRLLMSTGALLLSPLGFVMESIADAGFDGAELVVGLDGETRDPARVHQLADATGLQVPVIHGPYMLALRPLLGAGYVEKTRRAMALADDMGVDVMVAHAPFSVERRAVRWMATEADDELAGHRAVLGMENLFPVGGIAFSTAITPTDLLAHRHVVFDTSHFAVAGVDLLKAWRVLADRVVHIHVSDNRGGGRDSHAGIGEGVLDLRGFLAHVAASGYAGAITLEIDVRAHLDDRTALVGYLARQRSLAADALRAQPPAALAEA